MSRNINKTSFLIVSNYKVTNAALRACVSDCLNMKRALESRQFKIVEHISEVSLNWSLV